MDEQRVWIRSRRKRRLRLTAVILVLCLLFTTYPDILATLSASATEQKDGTLHVSGFAQLPEAVREQTVPVGTDISKLSLPDTLEAFAAAAEGTDSSEDAEVEDKGRPGDSEGESENESEDQKGEDENQQGNQEEEGTGEQGGDTGNPDDGNGDNTGETDDGTGETDGDSDSGEDVEQPVEGENDDTAEPEEDNSDAETELLSVQSGVFVMPVYMAELVGTVEPQTLERKAETVMIKGVTWQSEPVYDGNVEETYIFTAVLPEGYAIAEGASLPQITVTVQDDAAVRALIARIAALPDVQDYMEKEPDIDDWEGDEDAYEEAYEEWMKGLMAYAEEALAIWEEYEALTEGQQAQISEEILDKLTAWMEIAEQFAGSRKVMAAAEWTNIEGSGLKWKLENGTLTISGTGDMPDWALYSYAPWDSSRSSITQVVIDDGVTSIGEWAFCHSGSNYTSLKSVTIPGSVTSIGYRAFCGSAITSVIIPGSVTSIGNSAFYYCSSLESVTISEGVTSIGVGAFEHCGVLKSVTIPESVTSIGNTAFQYCTNLGTVTFKDTTTIPTLGDKAFDSCSCVSEGTRGISIPTCKYLTVEGWQQYKDHVDKSHDLMKVEAKDATCAAAGNIEHWECNKCDSLFSDKDGTTNTTLAEVTTEILAHSYTYTASGAVITEKCGLGCNHSATATLSIKSGANLTYTGSEIKPVAVTYDSNWVGTNKPDASKISYSNNIGAGTATAKLTISGVTASTTFTISSADISSAVVTLGSSLTYNGAEQTQTVTSVKVGSRTLEEGTDYTVSGNKKTDAGTYTLTITGKGNYTGTAAKQFTIAGKSLTAGMVTLAANSYDYTGEKIEPVVTVKDGNTTLASGTDYTVSYTNNTGAGTATVKVMGTGNYTGTVTKQFTIAGKPLIDDMVTLAPGPYEYTGTEIKPAVTVQEDSKTLTETTDYTVTYSNNTNVGTATVTVTGKGNYVGEVKMQFAITPKSLTEDMVTLALDSYEYTGTGITPAVTVQDGNSTVSTANYTVSYSNNTNVGNATITVTGKSNYTGTVTKTFMIKSADISSAVVELGAVLTYNGKEQTQAVTVKVGSRTLEEGTDYTVSGNKRIDAGDYELTITGKGNYEGTTTKSFTIAVKQLTAGMVTLDSTSYKYTGQAVTPAVTVKDGSYTLVSGKDYSVSYKDNTNIGTAAVTVTGTGNYSGTVEKTFTIVDKTPLKENEMTLTISGGAYGSLKEPAPKGSVTKTDTEKTFTYRYRADDGNTWVDADALPKSSSGYIIPGTYTVEMTYTGKDYTGTKTASFTVVQKPLAVKKGTLAVENRNYDGTTDAKLKEGGVPELSGVIAGDDAMLGGTLSAVFTNKGPKKDINVTVSGFELTGVDAGCYKLANKTLTIKATINNADGTAPSSGSSNGGSGSSGGSGSGGSSGDSGGNEDNDNSGDSGNSSSSGTTGDGGSNGNGGTTGGIGGSNGNGGAAGGAGGSTGTGTTTGGGKGSSGSGGTGKGDTGSGSTGRTGTGGTGNGGTGGTGKGGTGNGSASGNGGTGGTAKGGTGNGTGAGSADASEQGGTAQAGSGQQTENETVQIVQAAAEDGRIVLPDEKAATPAVTGNLTEDSPTETRLMVGDGTVIVEVASADGKYTAGAKDVLAVANAVLTQEQIELADNGGTIEVRVDIRDISDSMSLQDKETVEKGYEAYGQYLTDLKMGAYVDISVYIRTGDSGWNAVTETREPIEIVIGIPEELRGEGREYYVIRAHEGRHALLNDMDDVPETITIITDMFSSYAIAYRLTGAAYGGADTVYGGVEIVNGRAQCRLCHICPTFHGICCFIWLAVLVAAVALVGLILYLGYFCIAYYHDQRQQRKKYS